MDCMVTTALKSSLGRDLPLKSTQQPLFFDDVWVAAGAGGLNNLPSNDFSVDDLLDFSDKDFKDINSDIDEEKTSILFSSQHCSSNSGSFSETDDFGSLLAAQLAVPADDLESLEWLSQFVDDSRSELSFSCSAGGFNGKTGSYLKNSNQPTAAATAVVQETKAYSFPVPVPRKSRSVRTKRHRKAWSAPASLTTSSSSFSSSSSYGYPSSMLPFVFSNTVRDFELFSSVEKPPVIKKQKKKPSSDTGSGSNGSQGLRRCSHCQVQKTPQWRAGPLGPKTLCNACGVRYKSGRLFPEYRPACSPTYSQEVHSNSHRKVLEMRRKKDPVVVGPGEAGLSSMVPSY